jgi:hypothetical protein
VRETCQAERESGGVAKIKLGGKFMRAKMYRLASSKPAYEFQVLFHAEKADFMQWRGVYPNGSLTDFIDIPKEDYEAWKRRVRAGEAIPEPQLMSEWAVKAARPADVAIYYHETLELAKKWWKGEPCKP